MQDSLSEAKKEKNLRISLWEGVVAAINTGCGETYVPPFAIALGATNIQVGLLTSLPNLLAALVQLKTPGAVGLPGSRKKLINTFVFVQALTWIPILAIPFVAWLHPKVVCLIIFYAVYVSSGAFTLPAWGSMLSDSVAEERRGKYFGLRGKLVGAFAVVSGFAAGLLLYFFSAALYVGYALIFALAAVARLLSNLLLSKLHEPPIEMATEHRFSFMDFLRRMPESNFAQYVLCIGLFHLSAFMAGPYFAVLMLRDFGFSYLTYTVLNTAAVVSSLLGLTYWGRHADEFGNARLIKLASRLIVFLPLMWLVSHNVVYLFCVQLIAGYLWGGFNLCCANFIYDAAMPQKRVYCISYYNVVVGIGVFIGTLIGGYLSTHLPPLLGYQIFPVLVLSSLGRMVVSAWLLPRVREVRPVKTITRRDLFLRITGLAPVSGESDPSFLSLRKPRTGE